MSSTAAADSLTRSVEDYLKAIYRLTPEGRPASTSEIAHLLELSAPSVSGMVKRLSELGLLEHLPYKGVQLTPEGRRAALRMVRRHRLIESYLVEFLGYSWDTVHQEAERLEHAVSDTLVERMAAALGHPTVDPHGDPIPTADGSVQEAETSPLAVLDAGDTAEIVRVVENDADRLRYLATLGLKPGATVTVLDRQPFGGPVTIETRGEIQVIGQALALVLLCAVGARR
jgi:DtxR family transcriptional regulator, Mn-dependent transcriptional regulator